MNTALFRDLKTKFERIGFSKELKHLALIVIGAGTFTMGLMLVSTFLTYRAIAITQYHDNIKETIYFNTRHN